MDPIPAQELLMKKREREKGRKGGRKQEKAREAREEGGEGSLGKSYRKFIKSEIIGSKRKHRDV